MKKLLLASTALVGFAGAAAAEITIEGYAEMGVAGGGGEYFDAIDGVTVDGPETQFHNSTKLNFKMTGETDSGLSFGATYRFDMDNGSSNNQDPDGDNETVWIEGAFGKITLGDTDGALDWSMTETDFGTTLTDDHTTHIGWYSNNGLDSFYDDQVMRYEYSMGDFAAAFSLELPDGADGADPVIGIGGKYSTSMGGVDLGFGLGYQTVSGSIIDAEAYGLSVSAAFAGGFEVVGNYMKLSYEAGGSDFDAEHYGIGVAYTMDALLLTANYGKWEYDAGLEGEGWAIAANYDLGGGAVLMAGYGNSDGQYVRIRNGGVDRLEDYDNFNTFSIGLGLSF